MAPRNGSLESYTSTTRGLKVFYSCDPGLVPEGRMRAVCTVNGWSPNPADLSCTVGMLLVTKACLSVPCVREYVEILVANGHTQYCSLNEIGQQQLQ